MFVAFARTKTDEEIERDCDIEPNVANQDTFMWKHPPFYFVLGGFFDSEQKAKECCDKFNTTKEMWMVAEYIEIKDEDMNIDMLNDKSFSELKKKIYKNV